jgi:hypothetical protein
MEVFAGQLRASGVFSLYMDTRTMECLYLISLYPNYKGCYNRCFSSPLTEDQVAEIETINSITYEGKPLHCPSYWVGGFCKLAAHALTRSVPESVEFQSFCDECLAKRGGSKELRLEESKGIDALARSMDDLEKEKHNETIRENYRSKAKAMGFPTPQGLDLILFFIAHLDDAEYAAFLDTIRGRFPILTDRQSLAIEEWKGRGSTTPGRKMDPSTLIWMLLSSKM